MDKFDHFVKEQLHAKFYIRYMDDFLIISHDKEYLQRCMAEIREQLTQLDFELNEKKTILIYGVNNNANHYQPRYESYGTRKT